MGFWGGGMGGGYTCRNDRRNAVATVLLTAVRVLNVCVAMLLVSIVFLNQTF